MSSSSSSTSSSTGSPVVRLTYTIHSYSSYSSNFLPENILRNDAKDQMSRWSSENNTPPQFITLRLQHPAIIHTITFGKYEKNHVCNLKKFKIQGGLSEECMIDLLEGGLTNDPHPQTFPLPHLIPFNTYEPPYIFPIQYLKIIPLQSWGPSFNFSIWYVELNGVEDEAVVEGECRRVQDYQEKEAVRGVMKFLRDHPTQYASAYKELLKSTSIRLEHPMMTQLYELIQKSDYDGVEEFVKAKLFNNMDDNFLQEYILKMGYVKAKWERIRTTDNGLTYDDSDYYDEEEEEEEFPGVVLAKGSGFAECGVGSVGTGVGVGGRRPGPRGGHQMVILDDSIYLFGGWNGTEELNDFWVYHTESNRWELLSWNTEVDGGPSPRSCHKMCVDKTRRQIFLLGRYVDISSSSAGHNNNQDSSAGKKMKSDFYLYDIDTQKWTLITDDTLQMGGPPLTYDHQMCVDEDQAVLWVFGGCVVSSKKKGSVEEADSSPPSSRPDLRGRLLESLSRNIDRQGGGGGEPRHALPSHEENDTPASLPVGSGLYSYHIPTNTWREESVKCDIGSILKPRVAHSMLFLQSKRQLLIFGGYYATSTPSSSKEFLPSLIFFNVDSRQVDQVVETHMDFFHNSPSSQQNLIIQNGFTQRATVDEESGEIYLFLSVMKEKTSSAMEKTAGGGSGATATSTEQVHNSLWIYDLKKKRKENYYCVRGRKWVCVYKSNSGSNFGGNGSDGCDGLSLEAQHPTPRFSHQMVYSPSRQLHYLFGGNPGGTATSSPSSKPKHSRLSDLWSLSLTHHLHNNDSSSCSPSSLLRHSLIVISHIRKVKYFELTQSDCVLEAMHYLQNDLKEVIDLSVEKERGEFERLTLVLFEDKKKGECLDIEMKKNELFSELCKYFPDEMTQPRWNLVERVPLV